LKCLASFANQPDSSRGTLTRTMLEDYLGWLQELGTARHDRARALTTALRYVGSVELLWKWADDRQEDTPTWSGLVPKGRRITRDISRPAVQYREAPTWAEMAAGVQATRGWLRDLTTILYYTGLRVGQALFLRRDDVDVTRGMLRIRGELGKTRQERAGRLIPVSPHFISWVAELPEVPEGWLIDCGITPRNYRSRDMERAWNRAEVRREVWTGRPFHAFRAGWMSSLRGLGGDWDVIEWLVGHAPATKTARSYLDPSVLPGREVVALIPSLASMGCADDARVGGPSDL
jgi:integrase